MASTARIALLLVAAAVVVAVPALPGPAEAEESLVRPGKRRPARPPGGSGKASPGPRPDRAAEPPAGGDKARNQLLVQRYLGVLESRPAEQFAMSRLVEIYRQEHGTLDGLVRELEGRVESEPRGYAPRMILGELYRRSGRLEDAARLFRAAAEVRPSEPGPRLAAARVAGELGDAETAGRELEAALERSTGPERTDVLRELRDLALEQGDLGAARRHHDALVRASASSLYVRLELGQALARLERHAEALEELEAVLAQVRGDPRARVPVEREIARSQMALGRDQAALETLRRAIRQTEPGTGERAELHEMLVDVYRRRDDLRGLVELLEGEGGRGFEAAELLGRLNDELGQAEQAERWYRAALRASQRHVDTRVRLIRLLIRQGRIEEATREYETLVRLAPREPRFLTELAEMYLRLGERGRALALLARAGRSSPGDAALHSALLEIYGAWGEEALALEEARLLTRIDPRDETHLVELGERLFQAGETERALATWRRIPQVAAERWRGLAALADVYADHDMGDQAVALYEEALGLRPSEPAILRRLANLLERLRRFDQAVERWEQVIAVAAEDDDGARREARTRIVTIWANQRTIERRLPELRRRFGASPPEVEAGRFLYEALVRLSRNDEAVRVMRRVAELRPGDVETRLALELALVRLGDLAGAMDEVRGLLELAPRRSRELYQRLSSYAMQLRDDEQALEYAGRALALNPDDAQGHLRLAQLHRQQGNAGRAIAEYRRALELNDRLYEAYVELAELHETRSETREAGLVYVRLLAKSPDDGLVARAGRQAVLLAVTDGTLGVLEDDLLPLALAHTERAVYRRVLVELYGNLTWPLVQVAAYGRPEAAARARAELAAVGQRSLQPLLDALLDPDPEQQEAAIGMLGHLGNSSAAVPLLAFATGTEAPPAMRARALLAAGQVGDEAVVSALARIVVDDVDPNVRAAAAFGLGRIATPRAVAALERLVGGPVVSLRALACIGLGRAGRSSHVEVLVQALEADSSPLVRAAAAWALGRLGERRAEDALVRALRSAPAEVRRAAAWALGASGEGRAARDLAAALFDQDAEIRAVAAWALRRAGSGPATGSDEGAYHRMTGGQLRIQEYVDDLLRHPRDEGSARAAFELAGPEIEDALASALGSGGRPRTERAVVALRALEAPEPGRLLLAPLVAPAELEDEVVARAMGAVRELAVTRASDLLRNRSPQVRALAARSLGRAGGERAVRALSDASADEELGVQELALDQLGRMRATGAVPAIARLLEAPSPATRARAVRALGRIGGEDALGRLAPLVVSETSPEVRVTAVRALARHAAGEPVAARALAAAAAAPDPQTRQVACAALEAAALPEVAVPPPCRSDRRALEGAR